MFVAGGGSGVSLLDGILEFGCNATVLQLRYYSSAPAAVIVAVAVAIVVVAASVVAAVGVSGVRLMFTEMDSVMSAMQ